MTTRNPIPPRNIYWINNSIAGSARLTSLAEIKWLFLNGFRLVITLTEEPLPKELVHEMEERGIRWVWEPIPDFSPPTIEQMNRILKLIYENEKRGDKILIHCGAGLGRTGTVLACYLVSKRVDAQHAIEKVRNARPGAIESVSQVIFVYNYERIIKNQKYI